MNGDQRHDSTDDLGRVLGELPEAEALALRQVADRLESERPVPAIAWRSRLNALLGTANPRNRPPQLGLLITAYAGAGAVLLAIPLLGLVGIGPLDT